MCKVSHNILIIIVEFHNNLTFNYFYGTILNFILAATLSEFIDLKEEERSMQIAKV